MKWVTLIGRQPSWSIRLTDVRCFALHLAHFDPITEVPPQDAVSPARRAKPYIYNDAEITALLAAALSLPPANARSNWPISAKLAPDRSRSVARLWRKRCAPWCA